MNEEKIEVKPTSDPSPEEKPAEIDSQVVKTEEEKEVVPEETTPKPAPQEPKTVPYERFSEVNRRKKELEAENIKLKQSSTLSEEELLTKYPDWEFLTDEQKGFIKRQETLEKDIRELKEKTAWDENYANTLTQFPQLKGKEAEFKEFCYNGENIGNKNLVVLAKAFIFDKGEPVEPEKTPRKGLETPTGGTKTAPVTGWSVEDVKRLRETDPKKYLDMIQKGQLKAKDMK